MHADPTGGGVPEPAAPSAAASASSDGALMKLSCASGISCVCSSCDMLCNEAALSRSNCFASSEASTALPIDLHRKHIGATRTSKYVTA
jgi:hypothetical protein